MKINIPFVLVFLAIILVIGRFIYSVESSRTSKNEMSQTPLVTKDIEQNTTVQEDSIRPVKNNGISFSRSASMYIEFDKSAYEKAIEDGKLIVLIFHANWCAVCEGESPELIEGFNLLNNEHVVGFKLNYQDEDTDDMEKTLAQEFKVTYGHTILILKDGREGYKTEDLWDRSDLLYEVNKLL